MDIELEDFTPRETEQLSLHNEDDEDPADLGMNYNDNNFDENEDDNENDGNVQVITESFVRRKKVLMGIIFFVWGCLFVSILIISLSVIFGFTLNDMSYESSSSEEELELPYQSEIEQIIRLELRLFPEQFTDRDAGVNSFLERLNDATGGQSQFSASSGKQDTYASVAYDVNQCFNSSTQSEFMDVNIPALVVPYVYYLTVGTFTDTFESAAELPFYPGQNTHDNTTQFLEYVYSNCTTFNYLRKSTAWIGDITTLKTCNATLAYFPDLYPPSDTILPRKNDTRHFWRVKNQALLSIPVKEDKNTTVSCQSTILLTYDNHMQAASGILSAPNSAFWTFTINSNLRGVKNTIRSSILAYASSVYSQMLEYGECGST